VCRSLVRPILGGGAASPWGLVGDDVLGPAADGRPPRRRHAAAGRRRRRRQMGATDAVVGISATRLGPAARRPPLQGSARWVWRLLGAEFGAGVAVKALHWFVMACSVAARRVQRTARPQPRAGGALAICAAAALRGIHSCATFPRFSRGEPCLGRRLPSVLGHCRRSRLAARSPRHRFPAAGDPADAAPRGTPSRHDGR